MRFRTASRVAATFLVAAAFLAAAAQSPSGGRGQAAATREPAVVVETRDLLDSIRHDSDVLARLRKQMDAASGEERDLLERRRMRAALDILGRIDTFVKNIVAIEAQGLDASEFRSVAEPMLQELDPLAHRRIDELHEEMRALAAERETADAAARVGIDAQIATRNEMLTKILRATLDNIENMDRLGLDGETQRAHLARIMTERAETEVARLELAGSSLRQAEDRLASKPDDADLKAALDAARSRQKSAVDSLTTTIAMLRRIGVDATDYQKTLIRATGQITADILDRQVAVGLFRQWLDTTKTSILRDGPGWGFRALVFVGIVVGFLFLARIVQRAVRRAVSASRLELSKLLQDTAVSVSGTAVRILGVLIAFSQFGFSVGPLLAGLGIAGFIVGFALQDTLANFAAGMMILFYRPYDVGDLIEASGVFGTVSRMSLVSTTVLTLDHQTLVVPNGKIWGDVIKNVTAQRIRRVDLTFGVSYADDVPRTEEVLMDILTSHPKVLADPAPVVKLHKLNDSSVDFVVRPWVATADYWDVYWDVTREVKMRFDREGITIPFPQRDVHLRGGGRPDGGDRT